MVSRWPLETVKPIVKNLSSNGVVVGANSISISIAVFLITSPVINPSVVNPVAVGINLLRYIFA